jgi:hypothetical protein
MAAVATSRCTAGGTLLAVGWQGCMCGSSGRASGSCSLLNWQQWQGIRIMFPAQLAAVAGHQDHVPCSTGSSGRASGSCSPPAQLFPPGSVGGRCVPVVWRVEGVPSQLACCVCESISDAAILPFVAQVWRLFKECAWLLHQWVGCD